MKATIYLFILFLFLFFFFVGQPHEDVPIEEHPGNLTILMSKHLTSSSIAFWVQLSLYNHMNKATSQVTAFA